MLLEFAEYEFAEYLEHIPTVIYLRVYAEAKLAEDYRGTVRYRSVKRSQTCAGI